MNRRMRTVGWLQLAALAFYFGAGWEVGHGDWLAGLVLLVLAASFTRAWWEAR